MPDALPLLLQQEVLLRQSNCEMLLLVAEPLSLLPCAPRRMQEDPLLRHQLHDPLHGLLPLVDELQCAVRHPGATALVSLGRECRVGCLYHSFAVGCEQCIHGPLRRRQGVGLGWWVIRSCHARRALLDKHP